MKIYIDPAANIVYSSYYIEGLYETFGKANVKFSMAPFKDLPKVNGQEDFDHYFAFVADDGQSRKKIVVDFRDKIHLNQTALEWCHIYGKVNYLEAEIQRTVVKQADRKKVIAVGPNFGVRLWNKPGTAIRFLTNYLRCNFSPGVSRSRFFHGYKWQVNRAGMQDYTIGRNDKDYIFFVSTLWKNDKDSDEANRLRASYIRICKTLPLQFEGGLFSENKNKAGEYSDIVTDQYISHTGFVENIKRSLVVFNTPAVWGCHGWKLGEFMAMGKAIISSPFNNEMPVEMQHGENIHFVSNETELKEAIIKITTDKAYREKLAAGAYSYYQAYLRPDLLVTQLLAKAS